MKNNVKAVYNERKKITSQFLFENILDDYELREGQQKVLEWSEHALKSGKKFLLIEAPTGSGKSLISVILMKKYLEIVKADAKFDLLTLTKNLQKQYIEEFTFLDNLWGKSNYFCDKHNKSCDLGDACNDKQKGEVCEMCPHKIAYGRWEESKMALTNFHIHGLYSIFVPSKIQARASNVLIIDEAHTFEQTVNSFVSFTLTKKNWSKFVDVKLASKWDIDVFCLKNIEELSKWLKDIYLPTLESFLALNKREIEQENDKKKKDKLISLRNDLSGHNDTVKNFIESYEGGLSKWVADKQSLKNDLAWNIQPLWTDKILKEKFWKNYSHVIYMSGTITSGETGTLDDIDLFCQMNGIDTRDASFIKIDTTFDVKNRPIYYMPVGRMNYKNKVECWSKMKPYLDKILKKYKGKKGMIHCGNYEIQEWMMRDYPIHDRFIFATSENRQESIDRHFNSDRDTILVSPSMAQGLDLKDDYGRFQVILKMPYPNLSSEVNKQRFELNPKWYSWATVLELVQQYGRIIRSNEDYGDTIILDECFSDIMRNCSSLLPSFFKEAIQKINVKK